MKKRMSKKVLTLIMSIVILFTLIFEVNTINASAESIPRVVYCACLKNIGWQSWVWDGQTAGTTGESKPTEGFSIYVENSPNGEIQYRTYSQGFGWLNWVSNGQLSNTALNGARVDAQAIQIRLTGELAQKYDVVYRAHSAYYGWLDWVRNGETAGRFEENLRIEAIQVKLVEKSTYRAISLSNFNDGRDAFFMRDLFITKGIVQTTYLSNPSKYSIVNKIENLNTKDSDVTYIYVSCHGGTDGGLGIGGGISPSELKNILDKKPGTFVLMLDSCYSGKSIESNVFNTLGLFGSSSKYKMITSCNGAEMSGAYDISIATDYWAYGSGYSYYKAGYFPGDVGTPNDRANYRSDRDLRYLPADSNSDGYVTLKELANFSNKRMKEYGGGQTILYYPKESDFVLFK
ncbi:MAG: hypothetical protein ACI33J_09450 [Clostridium sp.]